MERPCPGVIGRRSSSLRLFRNYELSMAICRYNLARAPLPPEPSEGRRPRRVNDQHRGQTDMQQETRWDRRRWIMSTGAALLTGWAGRGRGAGRCRARGGPGAPRPHRDAVGPDGQRRRGGVSQPGVGGRARQCPWRRGSGAGCASATANRALRQQGPAAGGAVGTAIGAGRWHHARGARQLVGGGGGADRGDQPPQRARTPAPGAVPELLGRRSGPDQRALQLSGIFASTPTRTCAWQRS
jgi:hypothetical protein